MLERRASPWPTKSSSTAPSLHLDWIPVSIGLAGAVARETRVVRRAIGEGVALGNEGYLIGKGGPLFGCYIIRRLRSLPPLSSRPHGSPLECTTVR
jgi:hypothetical protein